MCLCVCCWQCVCVCAVQLFPAVFLQYSHQRVMELSQLERYCITLTSLHRSAKKTNKKTSYTHKLLKLCYVFFFLIRKFKYFLAFVLHQGYRNVND